MSDTYTKLFSSITASTIVSEPVATRWAWVTMLAAVKPDGCVYGSIPGLARLANLTLVETEAALACFLAPDPYSRTQANEGRRIEVIDGGWRLLNHAKYDGIRSEAERTEYKREWDRTHRPSGHARQSDSSPTVRQQSDSSPTKPDSPTPSASTSTSVKQEQKKKQPPQAAAFEVPDWIQPEVWNGFAEMRKRKRAPLTVRACAMVITELIKLRDAGNDPNGVLDQSTRNSWTDVYQLKQNGNGHANGTRSGKPSVVERIEQNIADRKQRERDCIEGQAVTIVAR